MDYWDPFRLKLAVNERRRVIKEEKKPTIF